MTEDEIHALREAFARAENRGDPSVQLAHRDEQEYMRMPPGKPPMDAVEAATALEELYADGNFAVTWESDGVFVSEALAVDGGSFRVTWDSDETMQERTGSWVMVFRRDEMGAWNVIRDIYNWDEPAP